MSVVFDHDAERPHSGHLLSPFGWAAERLAGTIRANPKLAMDLLRIDSARMHLIALTFAHLNRDATSDIGEVLIHGSNQALIELTQISDPSGLERVLGLLPSTVLTPDNYRRLVELSADKYAKSFIERADFIDDAVIRALHALPPPLRNSCILNALDPLDLNEGFSKGLDLLVTRGAATDFDALVSMLASISDVEQLYSTMAELVERLLLPTAFPPSRIEKARRIDRPADIRALAANRNDRLSDYAAKVNAGTCAVYLWEDDDLSAICPVNRYGRLGWFLDCPIGPHNSSLDPPIDDEISSAFSLIGLPRYETIAAIYLMSEQATL